MTTRKQLTPDKVDRDIKEIVERRLGSIVEVTFETYTKEPVRGDYWAGWRFSPKEGTVKEGYRFEFGAWLNSRRKMEFRHPHGDWSWWAQMIIQDELALKYDGTISDEGVSERWKVTPDKIKKYFHYRDWVTQRWAQTRNVALNVARRALAKIELACTPAPLRNL
jgi:hypothetical protein